MDRQIRTTRSRSETSFSDDLSLTPSTSRSATQDLAEFLKTSSPQDYKRTLGSSSSEDLTSIASSQKRSFRFLGSSALKNLPTRPSTTPVPTPLPNKNVVSKTTSRGKPYLQISVDYDEGYPQSHTTITARQQSIFSSDTSSDIYQRSSIVASTYTSADSGIGSRDSCTGERPRITPPYPPQNAQDSMISLDLATMGRYQQFLDSGFNSKAPNDNLEVKPCTPSDIVSAGMAKLRAYQELQRLGSIKTPPLTPEFSSIPRTSGDVVLNSPKSPRRRSRPNSARLGQGRSQETSRRSSMASDLFDDITDTEFEGTAGPGGQRKKSRKAPPRPGPPPNRSLPSLPEGHDDPRSKSPRKGRETLNVRHSQVSFTSTIASNSSHFEDAQSIRSDRKSREERVKARKAKDLDRHLRLMKEKKDNVKSTNDCESVASGNPGSSVCPPSPANSDSRRMGQSSDGSRGNSSTAVALSEHPVSSINSLPRSSGNGNAPTLRIRSSDPTAPQGNENLQSPASPALSTLAPCCSAREMELEARMLAVERKNKMLEQALMAVIRSAVRGQAQRRSELLKANVLEELLDEMDLDEFPAAFAAGGQMN